MPKSVAVFLPRTVPDHKTTPRIVCFTILGALDPRDEEGNPNDYGNGVKLTYTYAENGDGSGLDGPCFSIMGSNDFGAQLKLGVNQDAVKYRRKFGKNWKEWKTVTLT